MRGCFLEPWCWAVCWAVCWVGYRLIDVWNEIVNRSRSRLILWECFLWIAWAVWWGGLSFYAILVVPIGTEQLGSVEQGFITQKVSLWHNGMTVLFVLCLAIDALDRNKRALWVVVSLLAMITFALIIAHSLLSGQLDFREKTAPPSFYSQHAIYLWITAAEWLVGLSVPLFIRSKECNLTPASEGNH